jgi:hypothetical protein
VEYLPVAGGFINFCIFARIYYRTVIKTLNEVSTSEAEYVAASQCEQKVVYLKKSSVILVFPYRTYADL